MNLKSTLAVGLSFLLALPSQAITVEERAEEIEDMLALFPPGRSGERLVELLYRIETRLGSSEKNFTAKKMEGHAEAFTPPIQVNGWTVTIGSGVPTLRIEIDNRGKDGVSATVNGYRLKDEEAVNPEKRWAVFERLLREDLARAGGKKKSTFFWSLFVPPVQADFSDWLPWLTVGVGVIAMIYQYNKNNNLQDQINALKAQQANACGDKSPRCCAVAINNGTAWSYSWRQQDACCQFQGGLALAAGQLCPSTTSTSTATTTSPPAPISDRQLPASARGAVVKPAVAAPAAHPATNGEK